MNRVIDTALYREDIISLWQECFGDEREYIEFFLDRCPGKICLGFVENGRLISMLFLLSGKADSFSCKYIYAACTRKESRGMGLMGELIEFSKEYCRDNGIEFIFLVPAEESLYSYYSRFGFIPKMQRGELSIKGCGDGFIPSETHDVRAVAKRREELLSKIRCFRFDAETTEYTAEEFLREGGKIYSYEGENGFLAFCVRDGENIVVKELLYNFDTYLTVILNLFENLKAENVYIRSPLVYNNNNNGFKSTKCGMLYPISEKAEDYIRSGGIFYAGMYLD